jgi:putative transposase
MKYRKSAHALYKTEYHLVWIPRYRRKVFVNGIKQYVEEVIKHVPNIDPDIEVIKLNVQVDHVHAVIVIPPRISVADAIKYIKSQSSKKIRAKFLFLKKVYQGQGGIWSRGYCVSTVGIREEEILRYVEYQAKEDSGQLKLTL